MKKYILYATTCLLIATSAGAQQPEENLSEAEKAFHAADVIPDGQLDRGEYDIYSYTTFKGIDQDDDGRLMPEECLKNCFKGIKPGETKLGAGKLDYKFSPIDLDENGYISNYEYLLYDRERFDQMDINHNGSLDKEEFCSVYEPMKPCVFTGIPG